MSEPETDAAVPPGPPDPRTAPGRAAALLRISADALLVAVLLSFGLALQSARDGGLPVVAHLSSDAANIACFAAGADHRERFAGDPLLEDEATTAYYATVHVPLVRALGSALGDYGKAFTSLVAVHVLVQGLGFYVLGVILLRSRPWAALLAIATLVPLGLNLGTFWGAFPDPLPRVTFQALWPWALALTVRWSPTPRRWPLALAFFGVLAWVHPPSAPAAGLSAWLGLLAARLEGAGLRDRARHALWAALAFLATALPFYVTYLLNRVDAGEALDPTAVRAALEYRFAHGLLDVPELLVEFLDLLADKGVLWIGLTAAIALLFSRGESALHARRIGLWALGFVLAGAGLPLLDWVRARALDRVPGQVDLVRAVRYLVPLCLVAATLAARHLTARAPRRWRAAVAALGVLVMAQHVVRYWPGAAVSSAAAQWRRGCFACAEDPTPDWTRTLLWLREHGPERGTVLAVDAPGAMAVRFVALRPLAWSFKDGSTFGYVDRPRLLRWHARALAMDRLRRIQAGAPRWHAAADLADRLEPPAGALLVRGEASDRSPPGWRIAHAAGPWFVLMREARSSADSTRKPGSPSPLAAPALTD